MRRLPGFTLIELIIALVVSAVMVVLAFPSYEYYLRRAVRAQAPSSS